MSKQQKKRRRSTRRKPGQPGNLGGSGPASGSLLRKIDRVMELAGAGRGAEALAKLEGLGVSHPRSAEVAAACVALALKQGDASSTLRGAKRWVGIAPGQPDAWAALGIGYLTCGHPGSAMKAFRALITGWPEDRRVPDLTRRLQEFREEAERAGRPGTDAYIDMLADQEHATELLERGRPNEAEAVLAPVAAAWPACTIALNNLALCQLVLGKADEARLHAGRSAELDPDNPHALAILVRAHWLSGDRDAARAAAERLAASRHEHPDREVKQAETLAFLGWDERVLAIAQGAREECGSAGILFHFGAVAASRLGNEEEARRLWRRARKEGVAPPLVAECEAELHMPKQQREGPWYLGLSSWMPHTVYQRLLRLGESGTRATPDLAAFLDAEPSVRALAANLLDHGDPAARKLILLLASVSRDPVMLAAVRDFALGTRGSDRTRLRALQIAQEAGALPEQGHRMLMQGEWQEVAAYQLEIHDEPTVVHSPEANDLKTRGVHAMSAGRLTEAERHYRRILELEPRSPDILHNLAALDLQRGRERQARAQLADIVRDYPDYAFARISLAMCCLAADSVAEAQALLAPMASRRRFNDQEYAAYLHASGRLAVAQEDIEQAEGMLRALREFAPEHPSVDDLGNHIAAATLMAASRRGW